MSEKTCGDDGNCDNAVPKKASSRGARKNIREKASDEGKKAIGKKLEEEVRKRATARGDTTFTYFRK